MLALKEFTRQVLTTQRKDYQTYIVIKKHIVWKRTYFKVYFHIWSACVYGNKEACDEPTKFWLLRSLRQDVTTVCPTNCYLSYFYLIAYRLYHHLMLSPGFNHYKDYIGITYSRQIIKLRIFCLFPTKTKS